MVRVTNPKIQPGVAWVSHSLAMMTVVIKSLNAGKESSEQDQPAQHSTAQHSIRGSGSGQHRD